MCVISFYTLYFLSFLTIGSFSLPLSLLLSTPPTFKYLTSYISQNTETKELKNTWTHFKVWRRRKKTKHWARLFQPTRRMYRIFLLNRNTRIYFTERTSTKDVYGLKTEIIFESCSYLNSDVYFSFVK